MARIIGSLPLVKLGLPPLIVTTAYRLRYLEVLQQVRFDSPTQLTFTDDRDRQRDQPAAARSRPGRVHAVGVRLPALAAAIARRHQRAAG